jgi:hypothetical protein
MSSTTIDLPTRDDLEFVDELASLVTSKLDEIEMGLRGPLKRYEKGELEIGREEVTEADVGRFLLLVQHIRFLAPLMTEYAKKIEDAIIGLYERPREKLLPGEREHVLDLHESYVTYWRKQFTTKEGDDA